MNINMSGLKRDYSFLFSGMNSSKNSSSDLFSSINLSDYHSIKTGSYGKLLKAYYRQAEADIEETSSNKTDTDKKTENVYAKELKEVQADAGELKESAAALMQKGSKSVFKKDDMKEVYSAVSEFAKDYNSLVESGRKSATASVVKGTDRLINLIKDYEGSLKEIGITIDKNDKLVIDENKFMDSDRQQVKQLFNGQQSLSYLAAMRADSIGNTAYSESNKTSIYTETGSYKAPTVDSLFNSII